MNDEKCLYCQGHLALHRVTRLQPYGDRWVIIENLPALVCTQCGERYYTPQVHDYVVGLLRNDIQPERIEAVAIYNAETLAAAVPA